MVVGAVGIMEEAQREPAGEEFELGIDWPAAQPVPRREAIGELDVAGRQRVAAEALALGRPGDRPGQIFRRLVEGRDGLVRTSRARWPAHPLVKQASVV